MGQDYLYSFCQDYINKRHGFTSVPKSTNSLKRETQFIKITNFISFSVSNLIIKCTLLFVTYIVTTLIFEIVSYVLRGISVCSLVRGVDLST